ncbi:hypothetical protein DID88_004111 [Monilinia fructigena]|uniref:Rho-GAP domain-containing protein n=1 Tax=Monilinia fructigena TaxID=38457 RepID=A0A395ISH7_9HELO|nr:hypothetical protein DID88_004111 [Monilinia fructigena]
MVKSIQRMVAEHNHPSPQHSKEAGGHAFFNNIKSQATKGAGAIHKNLFGKGGRSGSSSHKEPLVDDEHYVLKVINKPLVEQTRLTRISKRLEDSRDKTEFWMPSFPWRAIDYLNYKGSDVEGLYRVPGSGPQIKKWQRKFDEEIDIDLFECEDLYDINIIGSMLKAWLRELPDELLPKAAQDRIARECAGSQHVPQQLMPPGSAGGQSSTAVESHDERAVSSSDSSKQSSVSLEHQGRKYSHEKGRKTSGEKNQRKSPESERGQRQANVEVQIATKVNAKEIITNAEVRRVREANFKVRIANAKVRRVREANVKERIANTEIRIATNIQRQGDNNQRRSPENEKGQRQGDNGQRRSPDSERSQHQGENYGEGAMSQSNSMNSMDTASTTLTVMQPSRGDLRPLSPIKPLSPIGF